MRNVTMPGVSSSAGALAGSLTDCTVTWCSVTGAEITTTQPQGTAYELAVGGLLGSLTGYKGQLLLCIGCGNYRAVSGGGVKGIGGLIGSSAGNGSVNDTYASGSINSSFGSVRRPGSVQRRIRSEGHGPMWTLYPLPIISEVSLVLPVNRSI